LRAEAQARGVAFSVVIRELLEQDTGTDDRLVDLERRLVRLEEMAGL
jgi:hypothetical protein